MSVYQSVSTFLPNLHSTPGAFEFNINVDEINDSHPKALQPSCEITLKPHQLSLLHRCIHYENCSEHKLSDFPSMRNAVSTDQHFFHTNIGIIGDRVGSGKSYVILSLIVSNNIMERDHRMIKSAGFNQVTFHFKDTRRNIKTNVIVIPPNLVIQWEQYIERFGAIRKFKIIHKNKVFDSFVLDEENLEDYDVLIVTSSMFSRFIKFYNDRHMRFQRFFFDDVDTMNIQDCQSVHANFIWFVTAFYGNILYPRGYFEYNHSANTHVWSVNGMRNAGYVKHVFMDLHMSLPKELVKLLVVKNADAYVERSLNLPEMNLYHIKCRTPHAINILNGIVDTNVIECLNAGDTQGAISYISPHNKGTQDNVIDLLIGKYNHQCRNLELQLAMCDELVYEDERQKAKEQDTLIKRIESLRNKMAQIGCRIRDSNMCSICYEDIANKTIIQCCQNSFCFKCIHMWLNMGKDVCPLCKCNVNRDTLFVVQDNNTDLSSPKHVDNEVSERYSKLMNLEMLLMKKRGSKMLIFSNFDSIFNQIIHILHKLRIKCDYIKGNGDQLNATVRRYKSNQIDVLLVNTRNYGVGMNLENTTDIIMLHKFNTQMEAQVLGRAHRMGRTTPLNVYYLLHENEMSS
jgi:SNF2 family DNA or RNA helicase